MSTTALPLPKKYDLAAIRLTADDVALISQYVGKTIQTKEDLIARIQRLTTISVDGLEITLEPGLLDRLKPRAFKRDFGEWLREEILKNLHSIVGW